MMALACLNSKGLSSTAVLLHLFLGFTPQFTTALSSTPPPITLTPSPAMRKRREGEMGVEPENMAFTPRLKMFDLRKTVSEQ